MDDGLGHDLRIKYGLSDDPEEASVSAWSQRVTALLGEVGDPEQAGRKAALEVFGELDGVLYFSQADTIEALLARAKIKELTAMDQVGLGLRVKYKLLTAPTDAEAADWAALAERYIAEGVEPDEAGRRAADELFEIVPDLILKSQADTIEALLERARRK